jgi:hypothetical protein
VSPHTERPPAKELVDVMLEAPDLEANPRARPKLTPWALDHGGKEVRCQRRHLLGAAVPTVHGPWLAWHGALSADGWMARWADEVPDRAELRVWCAPCRGRRNRQYVLDLSDFTDPRLVR